MHKPHHRYDAIVFDIGNVLIRFDEQAIIRHIFGQDQALHMLSKEQLRLFHAQTPHVVSEIPDGVHILDQVRKKGFKTYVLSNMRNEEWYQVLSQRFSFFNQFDGVILSCHVNAAKPAPDIYHALLKTYNLKPEACLFLDDKEENIVAGRNVGIEGIVFQDHQHVKTVLKNMAILE
jgi:HAD superfamily hydrolase (TIGR01509 family)